MGIQLNAKVRALVVVDNPWKLTPTEYHIAKKLSEGKTNGDIAEAFCLSPKTISEYTHRAREKTEAKTVTHLAVIVALHEARTACSA